MWSRVSYLLFVYHFYHLHAYLSSTLSLVVRQTTQTTSARPKSCYSSLPFAKPTCIEPIARNLIKPQANNQLYPKTANFASSSTASSSQTMYVGRPAAGAPAAVAPIVASLPATNFASNPMQQQRQWGSSNASSINKSTFSDSRATPKRGRGQLQTQLTGGVIPFCGYCTQPIR